LIFNNIFVYGFKFGAIWHNFICSIDFKTMLEESYNSHDQDLKLFFKIFKDIKFCIKFINWIFLVFIATYKTHGSFWAKNIMWKKNIIHGWNLLIELFCNVTFFFGHLNCDCNQLPISSVIFLMIPTLLHIKVGFGIINLYPTHSLIYYQGRFSGH
jgi:hypothetical protein